MRAPAHLSSSGIETHKHHVCPAAILSLSHPVNIHIAHSHARYFCIVLCSCPAPISTQLTHPLSIVSTLCSDTYIYIRRERERAEQRKHRGSCEKGEMMEKCTRLLCCSTTAHSQTTETTVATPARGAPLQLHPHDKNRHAKF